MNEIKEPLSQKRLLTAVLMTFFVSGAASQPLGAMIPYLRDSYGLDLQFTGILISAQSVGNLLALLLVGFLSTYLGRRKSILITSVWMAVAYFVFASGIGVPAILLLACMMTGFARGGNSNFTNTMISTLSDPWATQGYNLVHAVYAVGALLSPLALLLCMQIWPVYGWRVLSGAICLLVFGQVFIYSTMRLPAEIRGHNIQSVDRAFLKDQRFWLSCVMLFCYIAVEYAIMGWLVTYFQENGTLPLSIAQVMNSALWLLIFIGRMVSAWFSGHTTQSKLLVVDGIGFFISFLIMFFSSTPGPIILGLAGMGLFMAGISPSIFAFGSESIRGNDFGSCIMLLVGCAGGIITPALVGVVANRAGMQAGMGLVVMLTVLLLASILVSTYLVRRKKAD